ncbi:hypothetical protein JTE90_023208 [Oedothorax gibbosus]|uniref:NADH dehydrogenase [ubiquinone] 1 alpha subcomplex assembly factor 3 n=1 Tax=Oedothorax gibbosus TaxID=931172 RepID=A0AAV6VJB8_9ARAC|nr:hypothetical protein JTE90_023208 [Oedothorax gibbosus]
MLRQLLRIPHTVISQASSIRKISATKLLQHNYEGDGKTTVTLLNRDHKHLIMVNSLSPHGFRLNNGIFAVGPMAVFPRTILQWNIKSVEDITPESLSLFLLLEPKIDILVIGTGNKGETVNPDVLKMLKARKVSTEVLGTEQACSIFNFLNVEGRCVAGAFIPPLDVTLYEEEDFHLIDFKKEDQGPYLM